MFFYVKGSEHLAWSQQSRENVLASCSGCECFFCVTTSACKSDSLCAGGNPAHGVPHKVLQVVAPFMPSVSPPPNALRQTIPTYHPSICIDNQQWSKINKTETKRISKIWNTNCFDRSSNVMQIFRPKINPKLMNSEFEYCMNVYVYADTGCLWHKEERKLQSTQSYLGCTQGKLWP